MSTMQFVEVDVGGKKVKFESGLLARQAEGSLTVQMGETIVFSAVTTTKTPREGVDYFPLQVEYREKFYAAGRFPGGYFKRETRPSEREILIARMTDRPLRPLFPDGYRNDVQIVNHMLCTDQEHESDMLSINAASAAVMLTDIPFAGPIGAVRVGRINGQFILNPTMKEIEQSDLNLIYVGTKELPLMIEGAAQEITEADMLAAMRLAHAAIQPLIQAQHELRRKFGRPEKKFADLQVDQTHLAQARELAGQALETALMINGKLERQDAVTAVKDALKTKLVALFPAMSTEQFFQLFDALEIEATRDMVLTKHHRIGGRGMDDLRPLSGSVSLLPRTHGSALFTRGETQAMATVTLGTSSDVQEMDALAGGPSEKKFYLHYNFPPFSVGEVGRLGFTGRREIGHGALAERSLAPMMPEDFPYTVRVVSEIMESNGSSSMATVCAGTLALMDAGVPLLKPVAGISIGLFTSADGRQAQLVTDIIGAEDHCGDMDFKVAGTRTGITGFHVDLKLRGLRWELVEGAFAQARAARLKLLDFIQSLIAAPRSDLSKHAPRITVIKINPENIGALIGPGGKNIRRITDTTGTQIDIEDDGTVRVFATSKEAMEAAQREINLIAAEAEVGKIYRGTVTGIKEFGAFVEILPGKDGLVHISEMADQRIRSVTDICKVGDEMWVKCIDVDETGRVRLSRKAALAELDAQAKAGHPPPLPQ